MGPLQGVKVIEIAALGAAPYAGMLLADLGADVITVDRAGGGGAGFAIDPKTNVLNRNRRSVALNLKDPAGIEAVLRMVEQAEMLTEGFRPGVMERLGLGPEACLARNPKLLYGRMTGWGQEGPLAKTAGHDINYIALGGALGMIRREDERPMFPLNLVGDMFGGMLLSYGLVCGLIEARNSGLGQVVDAAMLDGVASQLQGMFTMRAAGFLNDAPGTNSIDSGSHFYGVYECADGKHIAIGPVEPQFYAILREKLGLSDDKWNAQMSPKAWPGLKQDIADIFRTKTRDEWAALFDGTDACATPVLSVTEIADHPHNAARGTFMEADGILQATPAPRFSRTPGSVDRPPPTPGQHNDEVLREFGFSEAEISALTGAA